MLDALVYLEKLGKTGYGAAWYSTDGPEPDGTVFEDVPPRDKDTTFGELCGKFFGFIGSAICLAFPSRRYLTSFACFVQAIWLKTAGKENRFSTRWTMNTLLPF